MRILLSLLYSVLWLAGLPAQSLLLTDSIEGINLAPHIVYLEEETYAHSFEAVQQLPDHFFTPTEEAHFNKGFTTQMANIWIKCHLKNKSGLEQDLILASTFSTVDTAQYFLVEQGEILKTAISGRYVAITDTKQNYPFANFRFYLPADFDGELYIRINACQNILFPMVLWKYEDFIISNSSSFIWFGFILGGLFMFLLMMLVFFYFLRERFFLYYIIYIFLLSFYLSEFFGQTFIHLWPSFPYLNHIHFVGLCAAAFAMFIRELFKSKVRYPRLDIFIKLVVVTQVTSFLVHFSYHFLPGLIRNNIMYLDNFNVLSAFVFSLTILYIAAKDLIVYKKIRYLWLLMSIICFISGSSFLFIYITGILEPKAILQILPVIILLELVLMFAVIAFDYYELERTKKKTDLALVNSQQEALDNLLQGQEVERKRLAQELHDSIGSMLAAIKLKLPARIENSAESPTDLEALIDQTAKEVRQISHNLMPSALMVNDLENALVDLCNSYEKEGVFEVVFYGFSIEKIREERLQIEIYRIIQELLKNTVTHANATQVIVQVAHDRDGVQITVEDNGIGFPEKQQKSGIGMQNILNRLTILKGAMNIDSAPNKGTSIVIHIAH